MTLNLSLKAISFLLFLMLIAFALLQINDPDPVLWIGYYVVCSLVPLLLTFATFNRVFFWSCVVLTLIVMGIYAAGAVEYLRHSAQEALMQSMNPQKPYIEEAREFIGGLIVLAILILCRFFWRLQSNTKTA